MQILLAPLGNVPEGKSSASLAVQRADYVEQAAQGKAVIVKDELAKADDSVSTDLAMVESQIDDLANSEGNSFNLQNVINVWFDRQEQKYAVGEIARRAGVQLNIDSAATYGTIPDKIVQMFINSAETKATGMAKLEVAKALDQATGVAGSISKDDDVKAAEIEEKATQILKSWSENASAIDFLFKRLFTKVLNRVVSYQTRLGNVGNDLAQKSVMLDRVSASLRARRDMVKKDLLQTCVNGLALESIIADARVELKRLEKELKNAVGADRGPINELVKDQQTFLQILIKRLIDLKAFAVKEIGLYSIIGTIHASVAVIRADVEFTRTNLIAALGLQLGLVCDIVSALRIAKASQDVRHAEANASGAVGVAADALQKAANSALLDVQTTMRSLEATIAAASRGIQNTRDNMDKVEAMQIETEARLGQLVADLGNA
ncbi:hypothetical protein A3K29_05710 [Candidatus Collierbacteria bacterium RIFOXYB2_FULL_46_14]|uniref:Toxic anion resistance protein n=1 Tax=Candidatus Collierbacteria bacterium GW2011_GWA2_46_26 TaxID=1618381 RepID=A0A0G1SGV9_9BACT|nr:MAG: hypothetical protein UX47_C0009G0017 [Candidatus Collierbacteria bacterium GW2011_GWA2_46_26]OGD73585.1 MAG: hypothetical protein A3K29_05710 [Candidatus Collierbacteria bacterium RIFOXYB2_FULL_46_14]OGD76627.1 MAG: hypothetical protein A3K43_05710 [Candidatus Collierbacteria bacterium RIFOXYA2_FULL_46_20]OGD77963.1 MAG: hypothetical protein A3K39_05710 [Candidatus Collierbacteria bacterium RIFOXYC2_FULL_43_15]OGD79987.1 MAG: hypothetical protein A2320_00140 [Pseudomonadales bacterium G